jgi:hypothetical protein
MIRDPSAASVHSVTTHTIPEYDRESVEYRRDTSFDFFLLRATRYRASASPQIKGEKIGEKERLRDACQGKRRKEVRTRRVRGMFAQRGQRRPLIDLSLQKELPTTAADRSVLHGHLDLFKSCCSSDRCLCIETRCANVKPAIDNAASRQKLVQLAIRIAYCCVQQRYRSALIVKDAFTPWSLLNRSLAVHKLIAQNQSLPQQQWERYSET